jgi:CHAT domain-containing protein/tetratricopeptide (TPR) repeat protein
MGPDTKTRILQRCWHRASLGISVCIVALLCVSIATSASRQLYADSDIEPVSAWSLQAGKQAPPIAPAAAPNESPKRRLAGGESVSLELDLAVGEYIHITVAQKGIKLAATLLAPDGEILLQVNKNNLMYGSERLLWVAKRGGVHRLCVKAVDRQALPGDYEISIDERRASNRHDMVRIAAQQHLIAANRHYEAGDFHHAIEAYATAISLWRSINESPEEATALNSLGKAYFESGDIRKAVQCFQAALTLPRSVDAPLEEAALLNNLGEAQLSLGNTEAALEYYTRALQLRRKTGDLQGEAITLNNIGQANYYLGKWQSALDILNEALLLSRSVNDRQREAQTLLDLSLVYNALHEIPYALDLLNLAWKLGRELDDRQLEFRASYQLGELYLQLGDDLKAVELFHQALKQSQSIRHNQSSALCLYSLGGIHARLGQHTRALDYYSMALLLSRRAGSRRMEMYILSKMGGLYGLSGDSQKELKTLRQVLALSRTIADPRVEADTLYLLAEARYKQGDLDESLKNIQAALLITEQTRFEIVSQELRSSYFTSVRRQYEFYIKVLMQLNKLRPLDGFAAAAFMASESARARALLEMLAESKANLNRSVDPSLLESERSLRRMLRDQALQQIDLPGNQSNSDKAEEADKEIRRLTIEYQQVQAQIRERNPRYATLMQPRPQNLDDIQKELQAPETTLIEYALGDERSYVWAVTSNSISSYELPGRAVIEGAAREVYDLLTARQRHSSIDYKKVVSASDKLYEEKASALSRMLLGPVAGRLKTKRLLIVSDGVLQYIPFEALPIPSPPEADVSATGVGERLLVSEYEVVSSPSASVMLSLRRRERERKPADKLVAVLADPVFKSDDPRTRVSRDELTAALRAEGAAAERTSSNSETTTQRLRALDTRSQSLPRLPYTLSEARAIFAASPPGTSLIVTGFRADREMAMSDELSKYRIVHFATHGLINGTHPELSGIVLSMVNEHGQPENGFLQVHDIYNLNLSADLIVVSACNTGLEEGLRGDGMVGLTQGFMYAGAQSVVASLWKVDDRATAELMALFYKGMFKEGLPPAAALRNAKLEMQRQPAWRSPFYWAAFTLQGDYQNPIVPVETRGTNHILIACLIFALPIGASMIWFKAHRHHRMKLRGIECLSE